MLNVPDKIVFCASIAVPVCVLSNVVNNVDVTSESLTVKISFLLSESLNTVKFVVDRLLVALSYPKHYHAKNSFEWMEMICLQGKTNFFEKTGWEISKSKACVYKSSCEPKNKKFRFDADF